MQILTNSKIPLLQRAIRPNRKITVTMLTAASLAIAFQSIPVRTTTEINFPVQVYNLKMSLRAKLLIAMQLKFPRTKLNKYKIM